MIYRRLECEISIVSSRSERKTIYYCFLIAEALDLNLKMTLTLPSPWSQRSRKQYLPEHTLVLSWGWKRNVRASKTFSTALILKEGAEQSPLCDKRKVFYFHLEHKSSRVESLEIWLNVPSIRRREHLRFFTEAHRGEGKHITARDEQEVEWAELVVGRLLVALTNRHWRNVGRCLRSI